MAKNYYEELGVQLKVDLMVHAFIVKASQAAVNKLTLAALKTYLVVLVQALVVDSNNTKGNNVVTGVKINMPA